MFKTCSVALLVAACGSSAWAACPCGKPCRSYPSGRWLVHESANFRICCPTSMRPGAVAAEAERLRRELSAQWLGGEQAAWTPRCQIVLHGTDSGYLQAVPGGAPTAASSLVEIEHERVVARRIDVRANRADWLTSALPHELTHLVLADLFVDRPIPRWADEGMAVLADSAARRRQHLIDFQANAPIRLVELLSLEDYPSGKQVAFYGQSVSLVEFLVEQGTPDQFARFLRSAVDGGYESALRTTYQIDGIADLERRWRQGLALVE